MQCSRWIGSAGVVAGLLAFLSTPIGTLGQEVVKTTVGQAVAPAAPAVSQGDDSVKTINDDYERKLLALERERLERLERLAARQNPAEAAATYEQLFRLAIGSNLFRDAEPAALKVVSAGSPAEMTRALAHVVKVIAEADRGAYEQSLASLQAAMSTGENAPRDQAPKAQLSTAEIVGMCDAYYQRLLQARQYEPARKALEILVRSAQIPTVKEFLTNRLNRLERVGKPAPALRGNDLDGKLFDLASAQGKVVLVVFWASWNLPSAAEVEWLQQIAEANKARGLQIVGINLDTVQEDGQKLETVMPNIRHFLLDNNVTWPTLVNGSGDQDYAKAFGVTEIPANVLIGRDGTVTDIDLVRKNVESAVARAVGN
jgi:thiol-disulfide isomerase/thioredoxin